jgi:hypothetical protein
VESDLLLFGEINQAEFYRASSVGNVYLTIQTKECVYSIGGGLEFVTVEGLTLLIYNALFGL